MTQRERKRLFYWFSAAFVVLGTAVVLYTQGFRFDIRTFRIDKVGAIYVRSFPKNAAIFLDGKPVQNKAGFFESGTLINDLFPKTYALRLEADGYEPWVENFSVLPSLVSEAKYAVLIPRQTSVVASGSLKNFWIKSGVLIAEDAAGNLLLNNQKIAKGDLAGATDSLNALLLKNGRAYAYENLAAGKTIALAPLLSAAGFGRNTRFEAALDTATGNVVVSNGKRIALIDPNAGNSSPISSASSGEIFGPAVVSNFYYAWSARREGAQTSTALLFDKFSGAVRSNSPVVPGGIIALKWGGDGKLGILTDRRELYAYDISGNSLQKIADDVRDFEFSKDGGTVAAVEYKALEVFDFNDKDNYRKFNIPDVNDIGRTEWYKDGAHLFLFYRDHVTFLDLGDISLKNLATVAPTNLAEYDSGTNALFYLERGEIRELSFPQ